MASGGRTLQFERLLFFSDAVFAIAITLLVIEIRPPGLRTGSDREMADALVALIPNYLGFLVSFLVVGRFWVGHHAAFGTIADFDRTLVWRNLLFLGAIAFMPFPTAVVVEHASLRTAVVFYGAWLILAGLLNLWLFAHIARRAESEGSPLAGEDRALKRGGWMPIMIGALACAGAQVQPIVGLAALVVSPLLMRLFQRFNRARASAA